MDNSIKESLEHANKMRVFNKIKDVIMLDDYDLPVRIDDLQSFYDNIMDLYQQNLNAYIVEYNKLVQDKGRI